MAKQHDAWKQTLHLLASLSAETPVNREQGGSISLTPPATSLHEYRRRGTSARGRTCLISVLERRSSTLVSLSWCDATLGRYAEQDWRLQEARSSTVCALSGTRIERGDLIYRLRYLHRNTLNASCAILAEELERLERNIYEYPATHAHGLPF